MTKCIFSNKQFDDPLENPQWRKVNQEQFDTKKGSHLEKHFMTGQTTRVTESFCLNEFSSGNGDQLTIHCIISGLTADCKLKAKPCERVGQSARGYWVGVGGYRGVEGGWAGWGG